MTQDLDRLERLITFLPYNLVEQVVVDGVPLEPCIRTVEGALLSAELSFVPPRSGRHTAAAQEEEAARAGADMALALRRILEDAVFPRGGYLLKFSDAGVLVMFTDRCPGMGAAPWAHDPSASPAQRAARCGLELLGALKSTFPNRFTLRAGVELGRFRLALCGRAEHRLEQLVVGDMCREVAQLREVAGPGELVAGPKLIEALSGWQAHVGPTRGHGRRLMNMPVQHAGLPARVADLRPLLAAKTAEFYTQLKVLMPGAVAERVEGMENFLSHGAEVRPITVAAFPLDVETPDAKDDESLLLDLGAGVTRLVETVERCGGLLLRLDVLAGGSAAVAAFGVGETPRQATRQAVECALQLARRLNTGGAAWEVRAGIECGRAFLGEIGSPLKRELAVVGGPAAVALELAHQSKPGQVLVGEGAWKAGAGMITGRSLGLMSVGLPAQNHAVWEASALSQPTGSVATHREPTLDDPEHSPRVRMQLRLARLLQQAATEQRGAAAVLHGDTGSGKTAMLSALSDDAAREGFRGAMVRCPRVLAEHAHASHVHLLREALGVPRGLEHDAMREHIRDEVAASLSPGTPTPALFWHWLGLYGDEDAPPPASAALLPTAWQVLAACLRRRARQVPLLFVLEDAHHADTRSLQLLTRLMRLAQQEPMVVVASAAHASESPLPDAVREAFRRGGARWLEVPRLSTGESEQLLCADLGVPDSGWLEVDAAALHAGLEHAAGSPRTVHGMADLVRLRLAQGRSFSTAWHEAQESHTPQDLAQLKLDALALDLRQVARLASVLGLEFEAVALWKTVEGEDGLSSLPELMARLGRLTTAGILSSTLVGGSVGYRFRASAVRDVAYQSWPPAERARFHGKVAAALEKLPASQAHVPPGRLALHLAASGNTLGAVKALLDSSAQLRASGQPVAARAALRRALESPGFPDSVVAWRLHLDAAQLSLDVGAIGDVEEPVARVADDAAAPAVVRAQAWLLRGRASLVMGDASLAALAAGTGRRVLPKAQAPGLRLGLRALHTEALWLEGDPLRALAFVDQALASPEAVGADHAGTAGDTAVPSPAQGMVELQVARAGALHAANKTHAGLEVLQGALENALAMGLHVAAAQVRARLGTLLLALDPATAASHLAAAVDVLEAQGVLLEAALARLELARALLRVGDAGNARDALDGVAVLELPTPGMKALLAALDAGQLARTDANAALQQVARAGHALKGVKGRSRVPALMEMAHACAALGRLEEQTAWLDEARVVAQKARAVDYQNELDADTTLRT